MELKVLCDCGQKYAFDVEPICNQMPFIVNCPSCGKDGTSTANAMLSETNSIVTVPAKPSGTLRVALSQPAAHSTLSVQPTAPPPPVAPLAPEVRFGPAQRNWEKADMTERHSLALGSFGAILGAALGVGLLFGCEMAIGLVMPVFGLAIGLFSGYGARLFYKGTDVTLGVIAGGVTLCATGVTFLILFGLGAIVSVMVLMVTVGIAYKIAG